MVTGGSHGHRAPRLFGRERPLHAVLGGRKAADIILWRRKEVSAVDPRRATAAWGLFEVAEVPLPHADVLRRHDRHGHLFPMDQRIRVPPLVRLSKDPGDGPVGENHETADPGLHRRLNWFVHKLYDIACGQDLKMFILTVVSLYIGSVFATCFSSLTLLYIVVFCTMTVPALYERYEHEVDHLVARGAHDFRTHVARMDSGVLRKIPRAKGLPLRRGRRRRPISTGGTGHTLAKPKQRFTC
ncbi:hypothetical protein ACQ4PT_044065 [Festuca glaucescens]